MRRMYERPASRSVTFFASMSKPVTLRPGSESRSESGTPTYPSPMPPILAVRASRRSRRSCAICGRATSLLVSISHDYRIQPADFAPLRRPGYGLINPSIRCPFLHREPSTRSPAGDEGITRYILKNPRYSIGFSAFPLRMRLRTIDSLLIKLHKSCMAANEHSRQTEYTYQPSVFAPT